jgi:hypothetical protein
LGSYALAVGALYEYSRARKMMKGSKESTSWTKFGRNCMQMQFSLPTLRYVEERVRLYNEYGPGNSGLPRPYFDAAQIALANGDLARGRIFAEKAVEGWQTAQGSDSMEAIKYGSLAQDPSEFPLYGLSMKWKMSLNEVPQRLDLSDFEDWLWRRDKPKELPTGGQSKQLTNLRNRNIFLGFNSLPNSKPIDLNSYEMFGGTYQSLRHWCFLGELPTTSRFIVWSCSSRTSTIRRFSFAFTLRAEAVN